MSALAKIKSIGNKPYHGFSKLPHGYHEIVCFKLTKNKYAAADDEQENKKSIIVELKNEILFLPKYFTENINEDDINDINSSNEILYLYFGGKREGKT